MIPLAYSISILGSILPLLSLSGGHPAPRPGKEAPNVSESAGLSLTTWKIYDRVQTFCKWKTCPQRAHSQWKARTMIGRCAVRGWIPNFHSKKNFGPGSPVTPLGGLPSLHQHASVGQEEEGEGGVSTLKSCREEIQIRNGLK